MSEVAVWKFLLAEITNNNVAMLLCVVQHNGSSPGRKGFKMAVGVSDMVGSIGGGIMEHKLVAVAQQHLNGPSQYIALTHQHHHTNTAKDRSGMICSGMQSVCILKVDITMLSIIQRIVKALDGESEINIAITHRGLEVYDDDNTVGAAHDNDVMVFQQFENNEFVFRQRLGYKYKFYIVGGGHCALALSHVLRQLPFHITVIDTREGLNTMEQNMYAHQKIMVKDYESLPHHIHEGKNVFVAILTFGFRTDAIALKALSPMKFAYLGLLGSRSKIDNLLKDAINDSVAPVTPLHAPIGLAINSQTPAEIAISIGAEVIKIYRSRNAE